MKIGDIVKWLGDYYIIKKIKNHLAEELIYLNDFKKTISYNIPLRDLYKSKTNITKFVNKIDIEINRLQILKKELELLK